MNFLPQKKILINHLRLDKFVLIVDIIITFINNPFKKDFL